MTTQLTVRIAKTIQEQEFEPLMVDMTITETCPKKKYGERLAELSGLLKEEVFAALDSGEELPEGGEGGEGQEAELDLGTVDISGGFEEGGESGFEEGGEGEGGEVFEEGVEGEGFEEGAEGEGAEGEGFEEGFEEGAEGEGERIPGEEEFVGGEEEIPEGEGEYQDDEFGDLFDDDQGKE